MELATMAAVVVRPGGPIFYRYGGSVPLTSQVGERCRFFMDFDMRDTDQDLTVPQSKKMSAKDIMDDFGCGRAHAYKIIDEILGPQPKGSRKARRVRAEDYEAWFDRNHGAKPKRVPIRKTAYQRKCERLGREILTKKRKQK
jgi:hypothetical protein